MYKRLDDWARSNLIIVSQYMEDGKLHTEMDGGKALVDHEGAVCYLFEDGVIKEYLKLSDEKEYGDDCSTSSILNETGDTIINQIKEYSGFPITLEELDDVKFELPPNILQPDNFLVLKRNCHYGEEKALIPQYWEQIMGMKHQDNIEKLYHMTGIATFEECRIVYGHSNIRKWMSIISKEDGREIMTMECRIPR